MVRTMYRLPCWAIASSIADSSFVSLCATSLIMSIGHLVTVTSLGPNPTLFLNKKTLFPCWQDISRHKGAGVEGNGAVGGSVRTLTRLVMLDQGLDGGDGRLDKDAKGVEWARSCKMSEHYGSCSSHPYEESDLKVHHDCTEELARILC
ncbi:hypothetical protein L208DRAFT_1545422 [Tricholoma matsutake]|nr:hypothetical protein L208DRAFT_1545422 [Tricholoma matsutake 945]